MPGNEKVKIAMVIFIVPFFVNVSVYVCGGEMNRVFCCRLSCSG